MDPQNDFINGSLPVPNAAGAMNDLAAWLETRNGDYAIKIVTQDYHPLNHCSFAVNGGRWPVHCVAGGVGAAIWPKLWTALRATAGPTFFERKGESPGKEEYSIFQNKGAKSRLLALMKDADQIDVCGVAGDVCVHDTLRDAAALLPPEKFRVLEEFCPSLDGGVKLGVFVRGLACGA